MKNDLVERSIDYPVTKYREKIIDMVRKYPIHLICANTGAGKSTQVVIYLLQAGYKHIVLTVPSRTAAVSLAYRVSEILNKEIGDVVGYHTGYEKKYSKNTKIIFTTEGLELMKQMHNRNDFEDSVLIIDELQEWSANVETLVAWVHKKIQKGWKTKVILMSATMDVKGISKFFNDAPALIIPGKLFDIKEIEHTAKNFTESIYEYASKGHNVLAFVPGKREIDKTIESLKKRGLDATMLRLHGDLPIDEQQIVFKPSDKPKVIVATNIAQTSITIPDIDVVVDSGLERHMENLDGLYALTIGVISRSDYLQRKGRAGRTKPGTYIWCNDTPIANLQEFPIPDIQTGCIDQIVLKLASIGINATEVNFFHQPSTEKLLASQKTLRILGAFDENNNVTQIGKIMAKLPISVRYARMIVAAQEYRVLEDVITIAALSEFGGIKQSNVPYGKFSREVKSDLLAELDCFNTVKKRIFTSENPFEGVIERNYFRVLELRAKLYDILESIYGEIYSTGNRNDILKACATGMVEFLYTRESNGWYTNPSDPSKRKLNTHSSVLPGKYILGQPRNISLKYKGDNGQQTLYLISTAIMIEPEMLQSIAPHMIHIEERKEFNYEKNEYLDRTLTLFGNIEIASTDERIHSVSEKRNLLVEWLATQTLADEWINIEPKLQKIFERNCNRLFDINEAKEFYEKALTKAFKNSLPNLRKVKNFSFLNA